MLIPASTPCVVCHAETSTALPELGPFSMASDWRVVDRPLSKCACASCGLVKNTHTGLASRALFEHGYSLYAHAPGSGREYERYEEYATWIGRALDSWMPSRVLDVGCGNGSLLLALGRRWPLATLAGCDPSPEAVAHGTAAGLHLWRGTAAELPGDLQPDLIVSANVIEHTADPLSFLLALTHALPATGTLVMICPDGATPNVELLVADHEYSFTAEHLGVLMVRAGCAVDRVDTAPAQLGAFQLVVARHGASSQAPSFDRARAACARKVRYLQRWSALDEQLLHRSGGRPLVCFGIGEAAGLLRAYAPRTWRQVHACTADGVMSSAPFGPVPIVPMARISPHESVLVAVRPQDQRVVASRLHTRFGNVVTWYDLVEDD